MKSFQYRIGSSGVHKDQNQVEKKGRKKKWTPDETPWASYPILSTAKLLISFLNNWLPIKYLKSVDFFSGLIPS